MAGVFDDFVPRRTGDPWAALSRHLTFPANLAIYFDAAAEWLLWRPDVYSLWHELGVHGLRLRRFPEAARALEIAQKLAKDEGERVGSVVHLGETRLQAGQVEEAVAALKALPAADLDKEFWHRLMLARALVLSERPGDREEATRLIENLSPNGETETNSVSTPRVLAAERARPETAEGFRGRLRRALGF